MNILKRMVMLLSKPKKKDEIWIIHEGIRMPIDQAVYLIAKKF